MKVYEIKKPGAFIQYNGTDEDKRKLERLLDMLRTQLDDMATSVNLFEEHQAELSQSIRVTTPVEEKRKLWQQGTLPNRYRARKLFLDAKMFLYAADTFYKLLEQINKIPNVPSGIAIHIGEIEKEFPDLIGVRNSAHHVEDRVQGQACGKPIPVVNNVLIVDLLNGNKYGNTLADGRYGEIEVSEKNTEFFQKSLQTILDKFSWDGPEINYPL